MTFRSVAVTVVLSGFVACKAETKPADDGDADTDCVGEWLACALSETGDVSCWGPAADVSGYGVELSRSGGAWTELSCSDGAVCAIGPDGLVDCWGIYPAASDAGYEYEGGDWPHVPARSSCSRA